MARRKARIKFLLSVIELLFLFLAVEALQGKMCQNSLPSGGVGHLEPRFQGERSSLGNIFWFLQNVSKLAAFRRGRSLGAKISGEEVIPGEYFFGFYKTRHILLTVQTAPSYVQSF